MRLRPREPSIARVCGANAYEYHRDRSNLADLEALHQVLPIEASRAIFVSMMMDKAGAVGQIAHTIRAMERGGGTQIVVPS